MRIRSTAYPVPAYRVVRTANPELETPCLTQSDP